MVLAWIKGRKTLKYMIKKRYKKEKLEREARGIKKERRRLGKILTERHLEFI
jgi:hypothetical protein